MLPDKPGLGTVTALTAGEKKLIHGLFGDRIPLDSVAKKYEDFNLPLMMHVDTLDPRSIHVNGHWFYSSDYGREAATLFNTFSHESAHLYQLATKQDSVVLNYDDYEYVLSDNNPYHTFGIEQQASIIGDYATRFLHPEHTVPKRCLNKESEAKIDALLLKTVEDKFPRAHETRLAFEKHEKAAIAAKKPVAFF